MLLDCKLDVTSQQRFPAASAHHSPAASVSRQAAPRPGLAENSLRHLNLRHALTCRMSFAGGLNRELRESMNEPIIAVTGATGLIGRYLVRHLPPLGSLLLGGLSDGTSMAYPVNLAAKGK